jgi:hypothetical protein
MVNRTTRIAGLALLAAMVATTTGAQDMGERLSPAVSVPLDFLDWIGRDPDWLQQQLTGSGARITQDGSGDMAKVGTLDVLRQVNRIRTFAHLAQPGLRPPFYDLRLEGKDDPRCITQFAAGIVPDIVPDDFAKDRLPTSGADPELLDQCLVQPSGNAAWRGLNRTAFRDRYFDKSSVLKSEFADLAGNPAFLAEAIDLGFLVTQEDYSGLPRLEAE